MVLQPRSNTARLQAGDDRAVRLPSSDLRRPKATTQSDLRSNGARQGENRVDTAHIAVHSISGARLFPSDRTISARAHTPVTGAGLMAVPPTTSATCRVCAANTVPIVEVIISRRI